jgi:WD40 repeat protein
MRLRPAAFSSSLAAFALMLIAGVVPWLSAADDSAAPGMLATLKGHSEAVYAVAFTPSGKHIVTGSGDHSVKVWDSATGKELKSYGGTAGHQNLVLSVAVSPDGSLIASGGSDNKALLWDFPSSTPLRDIAKSEGAAVLAISADGTKLAGGDKDGHVKIWNSVDGKELFNLAGHTGAVTGLAFSTNGQLLVSSGSDKTLRFWNPANGQAVAVTGAHPAAVSGVAFSPNNNAVYSAGADGSLKFWALPPVASKPLGTPHGDAVTALALSADGNSLVSASADKSVRLTSAANGQLVRAFTGATVAVDAVALAPNAALIAAGTADKRLLVWQAKDGQVLANVADRAASIAFNAGSNQMLTGGSDGALKLWAMPPAPERALAHPDAVNAAVLSADGKRLYSGGADKMVRAWNLASPNQPERQFSGHTAAVNAVAVSANGQVLASAGDDETIRFWNQANGQQTALIGAHAGAVTSLSFNNAGQLLSASADGSVKLWQAPAAAGKLLAHPGQVTSAILSPDGARLLTGCGDKQVRLWNLTTGQVERAFAGHTLGVLCVAMNAAGTQVAAGGADKTLLVWEAATGKESKKFPLAAAVNSVAFSPDGKLLAAGLADNSIHLLDLAMGKEVKALTGHTGAVNALLFTPKGDQLVSASADKTVQVWTIADGKSKTKLDHGAAVQALALSKDGARIAAGGADKTVKVWTLADGKPQATIATPAAVHGVSFSPDGTRVLVGGEDSKARVYGVDGALVEFFPHEGPVLAVAYHTDGKRVFTASADKTVRPWSLSLVWQARHAGPVRQALYNGRQDRVVSCSDDKTVKLWNAADGKLVQSIDAHDGAVIGVAVNADATRIVSSGADKTVKVFTLPAKPGDKPLAISLPAAASAVALSPNGLRVAAALPGDKTANVHVFDATSGKEMMTLAQHAGAIRALGFLGDNRTLVSAGADKIVRLSDMNVLAVLDAHAGGVASVAFHNNGTQALSGGADKTVKLWDLAKGQALKTFGPLADPVRAVAFNRAGTQIGAAGGKSVSVWTIADGKELRKLEHPAEVAGLSFSADGTRLATAAADNEARVWELASGLELQAFPHAGPVRAVACHPSNNALLFAGSADKTVALHTTTAARAVATGKPIHALSVTTNGTHVLAAGDDGKVKLWNTGNGANDRTLEGGDKALSAVAVSKNGVLAAAGGVGQTVRIFTLADGKLLAQVKAPGAIRNLAFTPNSQTLAAACLAGEKEAAGVIQTWNAVFNAGQPVPADFGKPVQTYTDAGTVREVVFASSGSTFYSGSADKAVKVWKFAADAPVKTFGHPNLVDAVAFNPAGTELATGCHDGRVRIYDVVKGTVLREIQAHVTMPQPSAVYCLAWTADGKQLISGSFDHSLKLWNAADGKMIREFKGYTDKTFEKGHREGVVSAALAPDGKTLASAGGWDHSIKMWNTADGSVLRDLVDPKLKPPAAHPGVVYALRYTPDGKHLVSVGGAPRSQGFLAVWSAADGKLLHAGELSLGTLFSLAVSPDGKYLAIGTGGGTNPAGAEGSTNNAYVMKLPVK